MDSAMTSSLHPTLGHVPHEAFKNTKGCQLQETLHQSDCVVNYIILLLGFRFSILKADY